MVFDEKKHFEKYYKDKKMSARKFRKRMGCDYCKKDTATEAFIGWNGTVLWICGNCIKKLQKHDALNVNEESA